MTWTAPCSAPTRPCTVPSGTVATVAPPPGRTSMPELKVADRQWTVAAGGNLLDALNHGGVPVPYSCRAGSCHACLVQCVKGDVRDSRPDALSPAQRDNGWRL